MHDSSRLPTAWSGFICELHGDESIPCHWSKALATVASTVLVGAKIGHETKVKNGGAYGALAGLVVGAALAYAGWDPRPAPSAADYFPPAWPTA